MKTPLYYRTQIILLSVILMGWRFSLIAQQKPIPFTNYTIQDGLSQSTINQIYKDNEGWVWICHTDGVDKFDGLTFTNITTEEGRPVGNINFLFEDISSRILLATTDKGIYKIDRDQNSAILIPSSPKNILFITSHTENYLRVFKTDSMFLWNVKNEKNSEKKLPIQVNSKMILGKDKNIFYLPKDSFLYKLTIDSDSNIDSARIKIFPRSIQVVYYNQNNVFIGTDSLQVFKFALNQTNGSKNYKLVTKDIKWPENNGTAINTIFEDEKKQIWIGTQGLGLFKSNNEGQNWISCQNIGKKQVNFIIGFGNGSIWVGSQTFGLFIHQPNRQLFYHYLTGKESKTDSTFYNYANQAIAIQYLKESSKILVGTDHGRIAQIDLAGKEKLKWISPGTRCIPSLIYAIKPFKDDQYLVGTENGLYFYFHPNDIYRKENPELGNATKVSLLDYNPFSKEIWYSNGSLYDVFVLDDENLRRIDTIEFDANISLIKEYKEDQFLVGTHNGLNLASKDTIIPLLKNEKAHITHCTYNDDSTIIWATTESKGIFQYDLVKRTVLKHFDEKVKNFPEGIIYTLIEDKNHDVWFTTNSGLFQFDPNSKAINRYTVTQGIPNNEFNYGSVAYIKNEEFFKDNEFLLFGGLEGVIGFKPLKINKNKGVSAPLYLEFSFPDPKSTYGKTTGNFQITNKSVTDSLVITLPNEFRYLELKPTILDYVDPLNHQFRLNIPRKGKNIYLQNGTFTLTKNDLSTLLSSINRVTIEYRTANSTWKKQEILIKRRALPVYILIVVFVVIIALNVLIWTIYSNLKDWRKLARIQDHINEITRQDNLEDLNNIAIGHLINDLEYGFAAISLIDYFSDREIKIEKIDANIPIPDGVSIEDWKDLSKYSIDDSSDILVVVANERRTVKVIGDNILDVEIARKAELNRQIFEKFNHKGRVSLFFPIIHRALSADEDELYDQTIELDDEDERDLPLGVIEVGYQMTSFERFMHFISAQIPRSLKLIRSSLDKDKLKLELYTDNFAQVYFRLFLEQQNKTLKKKIAEALDLKNKDHRFYLQSVLDKTILTIKADYGNIALETFNYEYITVTDEGFFHGYEQGIVKKGLRSNRPVNLGKDGKPKKGITKHVADTQKVYIANDTSDDPFMITIKDDVKSEMGIPMFNEFGNVVGVTVLSSRRVDFFHKIHALVIGNLLNDVINTFLTKKRYNAIEKIAIPIDIFTQSTKKIYQNAVKSLDEYLQADHISVWKRISPNERELKLWFTHEKEAEKQYEKMLFKSFEIAENYDDTAQPVQLRQLATYRKNNKRLTLAKENSFHSWVLLTIIVEGKVDAFIYVFSKRKIKKLNFYTRNFLEQIVEKTAATVKGIDLSKAFGDISKSISDDRSDTTVQLIVDEALSLLRADSVALFKYHEGVEIKMNDAIHAGNILERHEKEKNKRANMANWVIKEGSVFFDQKEVYDQYYEERLRFIGEKRKGPSFWEAHNLKAVVAVKLEHQNYPLGVMFFNYTTEKKFSNEEDKQMINAFTNLTTITLLNDKFVKSIKTERDSLVEEEEKARKELESISDQKEQIQASLIEINNKYDKALDNMKELIPRATRASFWYILQGINHDIRNFLLFVDSAFIQLKENANNYSHKDKRLIYEVNNKLERNLDSIDKLMELIEFNNKKEEINLVEAARYVCHLFRHRKDELDIKIIGNENIPLLECVKAEIYMIFYNLVNNASQAIENSGSKEKGHILISVDCRRQYFIIEVQDNGPGIKDHIIDKIFDFGFTTKKKGLGIGLFFIKEILRDNFNGEIEVKSKLGKGTTFIINIPQN